MFNQNVRGVVCALLLGVGVGSLFCIMIDHDADTAVIEQADGSFTVVEQPDADPQPTDHDLAIAKLRSRLWLNTGSERSAEWQAEYDAAVAARRSAAAEEELRIQREAESAFDKGMDAYAERTAQAVLQDTLKGLMLRTVK